MEKRRPHYELKAIQAQMDAVETLVLTMSARHGIKRAGMTLRQAWLVIRNLGPANFFKSMTVHADHRVWQDVYHGSFRGKALYIKFQRLDDYIVVSFKEQDDE